MEQHSLSEKEAVFLLLFRALLFTRPCFGKGSDLQTYWRFVFQYRNGYFLWLFSEIFLWKYSLFGTGKRWNLEDAMWILPRKSVFLGLTSGTSFVAPLILLLLWHDISSYLNFAIPKPIYTGKF